MTLKALAASGVAALLLWLGWGVSTAAAQQVGDLPVHLDGEEARSLEWQEVDGAAGYQVSGDLMYMLPCQGRLEPEEIVLSELLLAGTTSYQLPVPGDSRLNLLQRYFLTIDALDASGQVIASGSVNVISDGVCPQQSSWGDLWWLVVILPVAGVFLVSAARVATREQD